jgi:hypothetical protein
MGKLEVIFKVRLAYPLMRMSTAETPAVLGFKNTGNTVHIEAPQFIPDITQLPQQGFDEMTLRVERACSDKIGRDFSVQNSNELQIGQDAAKAFRQLFEAIRESALRRDNIVFIYPVVPSEDLRNNPLVKGYESEWIYEGASLEKFKYESGRPVIQVTDEWWRDAVKRLGSGDSVAVYFRFALDAFYFAQHDPPRGIIMACAAWETALRCYLANEASKRDPKYLRASKEHGLPRLCQSAQEARGGPLFFDSIDKASGMERASFKSFQQLMEGLGKVRNKLLHEGEFKLPEMAAWYHAMAVMGAIEWLFNY